MNLSNETLSVITFVSFVPQFFKSCICGSVYNARKKTVLMLKRTILYISISWAPNGGDLYLLWEESRTFSSSSSSFDGWLMNASLESSVGQV